MLQLLLRYRHRRQTLEALGQAVLVPEVSAQRPAFLIERRRPAVVALRVRHHPQAIERGGHAPLDPYVSLEYQALL